MRELEKIIAELLLQSKAIKLKPATPFTWASGLKSPIYCDNRKTLSYPDIRKSITEGYIQVIRDNFKDIDGIAGVATGAIAQGALIANELNLPFLYIRSSAKSHGMENLIEGDYTPGQRYLVIEDLVSTGGSSLKAVKALRDAGCNVAGMVAIFTYGFSKAEENFRNADCKLFTLSNYNALIEIAIGSGYINPDHSETLSQWRMDPEKWSAQFN